MWWVAFSMVLFWKPWCDCLVVYFIVKLQILCVFEDPSKINVITSSMQKSFSDTNLLNTQRPHMMCSDVTKQTTPSIPSSLSGCFIYYFVPRFYAPQWFASRLHLPLSKVSPFDHRKPLPVPWHLHWKPQTSLDPDDHEELGCTRRSARTLKKSFCDILGTKRKDTLKPKPNYQPTKFIQKNVWKIQLFLLTKIRQLSGILKRKTQQCETFFDFVCFFCCFWQHVCLAARFFFSFQGPNLGRAIKESHGHQQTFSLKENGTGNLRECWGTLQNLSEP